MNDPSEGVFFINDRLKVDAINADKRPIRVCSLAKSYMNVLLWAHYSEGYQGVALEVELPDNDPKIIRVKYNGWLDLSNRHEGRAVSELAQESLSNKMSEWSYEEEVRVFHDAEWYSLAHPVVRVIVGLRTHPATIEALKIICREKRIPVDQVSFAYPGLVMNRLQDATP
jgi:hypothetical protein